MFASKEVRLHSKSVFPSMEGVIKRILFTIKSSSIIFGIRQPLKDRLLRKTRRIEPKIKDNNKNSRGPWNR